MDTYKCTVRVAKSGGIGTMVVPDPPGPTSTPGTPTESVESTESTESQEPS